MKLFVNGHHVRVTDYLPAIEPSLDEPPSEAYVEFEVLNEFGSWVPCPDEFISLLYDDVVLEVEKEKREHKKGYDG